MVGFLVPHALLFRDTPGLWPPVGGSLIASSVRVSRLLLWRKNLDPGFCNQLASRLLAALETLLIEIIHRLRVPDLQTSPRIYRHRFFLIIVSVVWARPLPLASRRWCNVPVISATWRLTTSL